MFTCCDSSHNSHVQLNILRPSLGKGQTQGILGAQIPQSDLGRDEADGSPSPFHIRAAVALH